MSTDLFRRVAIILEEEDLSEGEEEEREALLRSVSTSRPWAEREEGEGERESDQHVSDDDDDDVEVVNRRSSSSPPLPAAMKRNLDDYGTARSDPR